MRGYLPLLLRKYENMNDQLKALELDPEKEYIILVGKKDQLTTPSY